MGVDTETTTEDETQKSENGSSGSDNGVGKTAFRAAALAAATGATAYAAKRMLSDRQESQSESSQKPKPKPKGSGGGSDESLVGSMFSSGWDAAKDSLLPVAEDAAASAGEFVGRSAPEVVRDRIVPRFISGFERGRESSEE